MATMAMLNNQRVNQSNSHLLAAAMSAFFIQRIGNIGGNLQKTHGFNFYMFFYHQNIPGCPVLIFPTKPIECYFKVPHVEVSKNVGYP